jgi:hypothetical protein
VPFGCRGKAQIKKKKSERKCCTLQINLIALTHDNGRREREGERHFSLFFFPRLHCTHTHTAAVFVFFLQDTAKSRICFSSMNRIGRNQLDRVDRASAAAANQETRHTTNADLLFEADGKHRKREREGKERDITLV